MSWIKRCIAPIGSALLCVALLTAAPAGAQSSSTYVFQNQRIVFHLSPHGSDQAVALHDSGLQQLFRALGVSVAWSPGEGDIVLTTREDRIVSFTVDELRYDDGSASAVATFAPYARSDDVYLPFSSVLAAFHLATRGTALVAASGNQPVAQQSNAPAVRSSNAPAPGPSAVPSALAAVTSVSGQQSNSGFAVQISINGNTTYSWHRLLDGRWYVDIANASLQTSSRDETVTENSVSSLRVHEMPNHVVRVALSIMGQKPVDVMPSQYGLTLLVHDEDGDIAARAGSGQVGANAVALATPSPSGSGQEPWKFSPSPSASAGPTYVPTNPRLIVIDPGHGGSDPGSQRSGVSEKAIALQISERLRSVLIARGWQVQMTRSTDVDVYAPNDSAREELQARDDIANRNGARLFVSIHGNAFANSSVNGTTTYYYKSSDLPLANAIHNHLISSSLGTKDDGVIKNNFYVVVHAAMPAVLIETAFLSNPQDFALLTSPSWQDKVARAIADGIADYAGGSGATAQNRR